MDKILEESKFGVGFDARKFTTKEFINNPNQKERLDGLYYRITHGYEDLSRERILQYVNAEDFYQELFSACGEGDLYEYVIHSKDMANATKEFINFVENDEFLSTENRRMFIRGFRSSVDAEYIRAFEEEKEMLNNFYLKEFPTDGAIELATEKLVKAIAENKLDEKEIDYLSEKFRYNFQQKEKYGEPTKLSLENYSKETLEQSIKIGLEHNPDLLLDMQHSGQIVPVPKQIYSNDTTMLNDVGEENFKELLNGALPSDIDSVNWQDPQRFYHKLLGNELYNSDKFESLRVVGDDMDEATKEFVSIIKSEEDISKENKEDILEKFKEVVIGDACNDDDLWETIMDGQLEDATITLHSKGLLKASEAYLILGSNINWRGQSGYSFKNVEKFEDIIASPNSDYTIDITAKENVPYLEAMVYSHDVPTGSHQYILPESKWDELIGYDKETKTFKQGYKFIEDYIENGYSDELVKEIFHSKRKEIEMDLEAEKNPVVAKIKELYYDSLETDCDNSVDKFKNRYVEDAWHNVINNLADNIVQGTKISKKDYKTCRELLIKFNPTLYSDDAIANEFKMACQEIIEYNRKRSANSNSSR